MNCLGKKILSGKRNLFTFVLLIIVVLVLPGTLFAAEFQEHARVGVPLSQLPDPNPWFDKEAGTHYEYDYGYYDPHYYHYYTPGYKGNRFNDDWYYDTYAQEELHAGMTSEADWSRNDYFWGGYDDRELNDDWYYDYYVPEYHDYYGPDRD